MAAVQRARPAALHRPERAAARARPLPVDLLEQPRRVLHGASRRPQAPHRCWSRRAFGLRPRTARAPRRPHPRLARPHGSPRGRLSAPGAPGARGRGHPAAQADTADGGRPRVPAPLLRVAGLPRPHAARRRPGAPVPLHLGPVGQPGRPAHRSEDGARALRPRQGAAAAAPHGEAACRAGRGRALPRPLRHARGRHRRAPRRALPRHGGARALHLPRHPQRGPRGGGGRRGEPPHGSREGTDASSFRCGCAPRGGRRHGRPRPRTAHPRTRRERRRGLPPARTARPAWPRRHRRSRPQRAAVAALPAEDAPAARTRRALRSPRHPRRDAQQRHPAAPPVRLVLDVGAGVRRAGRRRPGRPRDQADALPHERKLPHHHGAHRRRAGRQAGARRRRDQGPLRRGEQHLLGPQARARGRPRRLRHGGAQDARQAVPRRASRGRRHPPLLPRRHRQLQPEDGAPVRRPGPAHHRPGRGRGHRTPVQPALGHGPARQVQAPARRPALGSQRAARTPRRLHRGRQVRQEGHRLD